MTQEQNDGLHADPETAHKTHNGTENSTKITLVRSLGVVISLVAVIVCSWLLYNLFKGSIEVPAINEAKQQDTEQVAPSLQPIEPVAVETKTTETSSVIKEAKVPPPPLPTLNDSDKEVQQAANKLTPALKWADWITTEEAVRKFVVVIDNMAQGKIARKYLPIPKPEQKFVNSSDGVKAYIDPAGFERYSAYISLFESIDNDMAAELYQRYSPLMEQAFAELGYPDQSFHDTLMRAFDQLLKAPVIKDNIELVRPSVLYKFADPTLERAPAVHKQLIRMGPDNTERLQQKIKQLKEQLSAN